MRSLSSGSCADKIISTSLSSTISINTGSTIGGLLTGIISTLKEVLTVERLILSLAVISTTPEPATPSIKERIKIDPAISVYKPSIFSLIEYARLLPFSTS